MIRINLTAAERPTSKKAKAASAAAPGALQAYLFLGLFGGGALVVSGALWWIKTAQIKELEGQIATAQARQRELQAIKVKQDEYEAQKRMLDAKIKLIETLQAEQSGPVHMLDEVSRALPDRVWLTSLDQTANSIKFRGESTGLTSVADFMTKLQAAGDPKCGEPTPADRPADRSLCYFNRVELQSSTEANNIVTFEVSADYQNVSLKLKAGGAAGAAGATPATGAAPSAPARKP